MINIYKALLAAQKEINFAVKDGKNPHFKSKYETLESVIEATKKPLNDKGLVVVHKLLSRDDIPALSTQIIHAESGEYVESVCDLILSKKDMQQMGSAQTYAKRQNLKALTNLPSDDDDGNAATGKQEIKEKTNHSEYVMQFGKKHINKKMSEISHKEHLDMIKFIKEEQAQGKYNIKSANDYLYYAEKYLQSIQPPSINTSETID